MRTFTDLRIHRVNFIEYNAKLNTLGSLNPVFPKYGTTVLSSLLRDLGYDVKVYLEGVSSMDFEKMTDCDLVCFPVFAPATNKVRACAQRIMSEKQGIPIVMGGPQVCYFPESIIDCCDFAVRCEGDDILPDIIKAINGGGNPMKSRPLVSAERQDRTQSRRQAARGSRDHTDLTLIEGFEKASRGSSTEEDYQHHPDHPRLQVQVQVLPDLKLFQGVYRNRDIESVIQDIKKRKKQNPIFFAVDNDFCSDKKKTRELLNRIIEEDLGARFTVFERMRSPRR